MKKDSNDWKELREFAGVDLLNSYVLSWDVTGETLTLDIDVSLFPEHPFYESPRPAERGCIRPGTLEFPCCSALRDSRAASRACTPHEIAKSLGHGKIDDLRRMGDGRYRLVGAFGEIDIESERPLLRLNDMVG